ncbi:MAG: ABC transporter substrate-binding protein [Comamonadaceae bacterium]|nr:MAG: ABC transporter substrate-binding protein [Comamonadaceae bacterium]
MRRVALPSIPALARAAFCAAAAFAVLPAIAQEKFTFLTSWYAQAEHGGYYQAQASGLYKAAGLDVTIKMGGPQVNAIQILAAGQADCIMGSSDPQILKAREQGVPIVNVAAIFQKDPQGLVAHPHVKRLEDVKGRTVMIGTAARSTYWPWLRVTYGFTDEQTRPYAYSLQPFMADKELVVQGYATYDPYAMKQAGAEANFFLFADHGWPAYANTVACLEKTITERPQVLGAFLKASLEGWKSYMGGADRSAAQALIKKGNQQMSDGQMEFAFGAMKQRSMVTGGDAAQAGIGALSPERLKRTYDFMVAQKLLDPSKVELARSYDLRFLSAAKVLP